MSYKLNPFTGKLDLTGGDIQTSGDFKFNTVPSTYSIFKYDRGSFLTAGQYGIATAAGGVYKLLINKTDADGNAADTPVPGGEFWMSADGVTFVRGVLENTSLADFGTSWQLPSLVDHSIYQGLNIPDANGSDFYWSLGDPTGTPVALADGDVVQYNAADGKFKPAQLSSGTTLPTANDGQTLIQENGEWVAGPVIGGVNYFTGSGDQYINDVELLMVFNGTDGSQTFTDSSSVGQTFTVTGNSNQAKISTTQSKFGGSSGFFDFGYAAASTAIQFQSNPFTVEAWIYPTVDRSGSVFSNRSSGSGMELIYLTGGAIRFQRGNTSNYIDTTTTVPLNTWAHVAVTRDSNDLFTVWINGVDSGSATFAGVSLGNGRPNPAVGRRADSSVQYYAGYVDDLRVTNGVCRYTADFTPPTAEFSTQLPTQTLIPSTTSRSEVSGATASIADGASADVTISSTGKAGQLLSIQTSAAAWVTVYTSQAARTADASRTETTDPTPGSGVIAEAITTGAQTVILTPGNTFFNNESTPVSELYLKVVNKSGASAAITTTLKVIPSEV